MFCGPEKTRPAVPFSDRFQVLSQDLHFRSGAAKRGGARHFKINSHEKAPNKAGSSGDFGIKLSEYAKSVANEDEFFIAPD